MVCPTALIENISSKHQRAYELMNFDLKRDSNPKFISEFHLDDFLKKLKEVETLMMLREHVAPMD